MPTVNKLEEEKATVVEPTEGPKTNVTEPVKNDSQALGTISIVAKSGVNIRKAPLLNAEVVRVAQENEKLSLIGKTADWFETVEGFIVNKEYAAKEI